MVLEKLPDLSGLIVETAREIWRREEDYKEESHQQLSGGD